MKNIYKVALLALCIMPSVIFGGKNKDKDKDKDKRQREEEKSGKLIPFLFKCPFLDCKKDIATFYDTGSSNRIFFCPNCRRSFDQRELYRNN